MPGYRAEFPDGVQRRIRRSKRVFTHAWRVKGLFGAEKKNIAEYGFAGSRFLAEAAAHTVASRFAKYGNGDYSDIDPISDIVTEIVTVVETDG